MKKYKLIESTDGLFRLRALRNFGNVKAGDLGGYVESENNLSHQGNAWISDEARVTGNARVSGNAVVCDYAWVSHEAEISGEACVGGWAQVTGHAKISGNAYIFAAAPDRGPPAIRQPIIPKNPTPRL